MTELVARLPWTPRLGVGVGVGVRLKAFVTCSVAALIGLEAWAAATRYGLRVTSDTPTFLPIIRDLAVHPFRPVSPFLDDPHVASTHASPYMQLLGLLWNQVAPAHDAGGAPSADPKALYTFLAVVGIGVTLLVLHAVFVWARSQAGSRAAWLTIPLLLVLFGPAHIIWAGDLTFHSFLYAAYFPQNVALAFLLYALTALEGRPSAGRTARVTLCTAAALTIHPFTGAVLMALVAARGCALAVRRSRDWATGSVATLVGFGIGLLWPAYSLNGALADVGLKGWIFVAACGLAPLIARAFEQPRRAWVFCDRVAGQLDLPGGTRSLVVVAAALGGVLVVAVLTVWEVVLIRAGSPDPLIHTNRLAVYWVEDRWRWPLMFAGGAVGLLGLTWLARRRAVVPALWCVGCLGVGLLGVVGLSIPVWWRFLLFAQVPLALGLALVLSRWDVRSPPCRLATAGLVVLFAVKVVTLFALPETDTYFGTSLQKTYDFARIIPSAPGLVATDPFTAFYIPGATGHRVLSVTKSHVNSSRELADSERGYVLLHRFYDGDKWWGAARRMYRVGVRYVVVAKETSLEPRTLADFSTGPTPLVRTPSDRRLLGQYFYRCNRVGTLLYDSEDYVVYRLDSSKLWTAS
jgi:hypothetical protein